MYFIKKREALLSTQIVYTRGPKRARNPSPQTQTQNPLNNKAKNPPKHSTLESVTLAFPLPRGCSLSIIVDGAFYIQKFPFIFFYHLRGNLLGGIAHGSPIKAQFNWVAGGKSPKGLGNLRLPHPGNLHPPHPINLCLPLPRILHPSLHYPSILKD